MQNNSTETRTPGSLHPACSAAGVPDAVLRIEGDVILISDHENKLLLNRKAALELLERLPGLIAKLPSDAKPPNDQADPQPGKRGQETKGTS